MHGHMNVKENTCDCDVLPYQLFLLVTHENISNRIIRG
jgi:hypothetical protein